MKKLSNSDRQILNLFKKADKIANENGTELTIFGQAGYRFIVLYKGDYEKYRDFEQKNQCIATETILFESENISGDGGDSDFIKSGIK